MERGISETEWRLFRELRAGAIDRFCQRVLTEISQLAADTGQSNHQRYSAVFKLVQQRDEKLADTFDNPRRSTALLHLARMQSQELLTDEELARFGPETRAAVRRFLGIYQA